MHKKIHRPSPYREEDEYCFELIFFEITQNWNTGRGGIISSKRIDQSWFIKELPCALTWWFLVENWAGVRKTEQYFSGQPSWYNVILSFTQLRSNAKTKLRNVYLLEFSRQIWKIFLKVQVEVFCLKLQRNNIFFNTLESVIWRQSIGTCFKNILNFLNRTKKQKRSCYEW